MSYINKALHKVQKEKESPYAPYGDIVTAQDKKPEPGRKWITAIGFAIVFFYAAGMIVFLYWPEMNKKSRTAIEMRRPMVVAVPVPEPSLPVPVVPPDPAAVKGTRVAGITKTLPAEVKEKRRDAAVLADGGKEGTIPGPVRSDPADLYARGLQKQREGKLREAEELYQQVIHEEPRHLQALNNLGVVHLKLKQYKWAVSRFNDALAIRPDYVDALYNLACLYAQKNDAQRSLFYLKRAAGFNPEVRRWASGDDDLKALTGLPEFNELIQSQDQ